MPLGVFLLCIFALGFYVWSGVVFFKHYSNLQTVGTFKTIQTIAFSILTIVLIIVTAALLVTYLNKFKVTF